MTFLEDLKPPERVELGRYILEETVMQDAAEMIVRKRDGRSVSFTKSRIENAVAGAFKAELGLPKGQPLPHSLQAEVRTLSDAVGASVNTQARRSEGVDVERIQDNVELQLMRRGHYAVARRYIIYREEHKKARVLRAVEELSASTVSGDSAILPALAITVLLPDGSREPFEPQRVRHMIFDACRGLEEYCAPQELLNDVFKSLYDGITPPEIRKAAILTARSRIEQDPSYSAVATRLLLQTIYQEVLGSTPAPEVFESTYRARFKDYVREAIHGGRLSTQMIEFDFNKLCAALQPQRDALFAYLGLQTIYDRYLLNDHGRRFETPQYFWMRVAMGLTSNEGKQREQRAIEFYNMLSTFRFTSATPTLFNSGTLNPQLSSCYLSTVGDDLQQIFKAVSDNAMLSKWAGGLGNDWTNIRATGSHINGTHGQSQGVIPFLKVVNDTAVAVNQGGKRKGAVCSYLESWHFDIEEFLDLRKNTGDDRRRTHDMHTANWIPDLFMKRVQENANWTLFSPNEVRDLHDLIGTAFEKRYAEYERKADAGEIKLFKRIPAAELWRKMLTRLFETGHPWITWKDPSNVRSPQSHAGVVHSSNLCTEILLNTSLEETAVCNLGSINLRVHIVDSKLDLASLEETVRTATRMLDNVIDINFYPTAESKTSNVRHRPIGLGIMGFQDALYALGVSYASDAAVEFADRSMEAISYYALLTSSELARERGVYSTYKGSKWSQGILPLDSIDLLEKERGQKIEMNREATMPWNVVRESIRVNGMRNSNVLAIAPTATISTIIGVGQSIEPTYKNIFAKSNLSGEFTQINTPLVEDLKRLGIWSPQLLEEIKFHDGVLADVNGIPDELKQRYLTAFEIEPRWLIECASRRQKWIDMGQSLNLYIADPSGKKLHDMYFAAWTRGLKTTYYLRCLAATQIEKSTVDVNRFGVQPRWMKNKSASNDIVIQRGPAPAASEILEGEPAKVCSLDGDCESCQ